MNYYSEHSRFTHITIESWISSKLTNDINFLLDIVKSILIHPVDASRLKVKYDRKHSGIFHAFNTTVDQILKYDKLVPFLKDCKLPLSTTPQDRAVLSCDHHALLFTSFMRCLKIPIRARTGFSKYIINGLLIPHWITEFYDENDSSWKLIDPERRIINLNRDSFLFAGQAWEYFFKHPDLKIPSYSGLTGTQGLKYAIISDINCIFKNELLGYEWRLKYFNKKKPDFVRNSYERMTRNQQADLHQMARILSNPDANIKELWELYRQNIGVDSVSPPDFS